MKVIVWTRQFGEMYCLFYTFNFKTIYGAWKLRYQIICNGAKKYEWNGIAHSEEYYGTLIIPFSKNETVIFFSQSMNHIWL